MKVFIAGASGGIGKYLMQRLILEGYQVHGTSFSKPNPQGSNVSKVDVTDESQVMKWFDSVALSQNDRLVLVNCVGINYNVMLHRSDTERWMQVIDTNLNSAYLLMKHIIPKMRERSFGRIILLSSVVPKVGVIGTSAYSASKAALWGLARAAACENAKLGITVNTINLGYFDIGMISAVPEGILKQVKTQIPIGSLGDPVNIFNAVAFLLASDYITGTELNINGGL